MKQSNYFYLNDDYYFDKKKLGWFELIYGTSLFMQFKDL